MLPPITTPAVKLPPELPIVDLTETDEQEARVSQPKASEHSSAAVRPHGSRDARHTPDGAPPVLNRFLTCLNAVYDKRVGGLVRAFHLAMQLAGCDVPSFPHDSLRRKWERLRASLPLKPAVTQGIAVFVKAHPQNGPSVPAAGQGPAVQAQKANQATGGRGSGGWAHYDPAQFPVSCNVEWTEVSDPPSQPMCARALAGFLRSHFHDNLCTVLDEYVWTEVSFANLGVHEEARALVEQAGSVTRGGWRVQWQISYQQPWTPYTGRGKVGSAHQAASGTPAVSMTRRVGTVAAISTPALTFGNTGTIAFPLARAQIPPSWRVPLVPIPVPATAVDAAC